MARFRIRGFFYVVLEGSDGELLLRTPPLSGQLACRSTILSIRLTSLLEECYVRTQDELGRYVFGLHIPAGDTLAASPPYASAEERERAIEAVLRSAAGAFVTPAALGEHDDDVDVDVGDDFLVGARPRYHMAPLKRVCR